MTSATMTLPGDVAAVWEVHQSDGIHTIKFEHGTTSGKRVIVVDGEEVCRKNWMFRLVGVETFKIGKKTAEIAITSKGIAFEYALSIGGKTLKKFIEAQARNTRTWLLEVSGEQHRVVLEIDTMDVYADGEKLDTFGEFTDEGTETHFTVGSHSAFIRAVSSGNKRKGLVYSLLVADKVLEPVQTGQ